MLAESERRWLLPLLAIVACRGVVSACLAHDYGYHFDETASILVARSDLASMAQMIRASENNPPLFYIVLHAWMKVSNSELWIRMLPLACFLASIALVHALTLRLSGSGRASLLAAALMSASALRLLPDIFVRNFSMGMALGLLCVISWLDALADPDDSRKWAWVVITTALGLYCTYFFVFVIGVMNLHAVALLVEKGRDRRSHLIRLLLVDSCVVAIFLPWLPVFIQHRSSVQEEFWIQTPDFEALVELFVYLGSGSGAASCLLLLGGMVGAHRLGRERRTSAMMLLAGFFLVPVASIFAYSRVFQSIFHAKYFLLFAPGLIILAAVGLGNAKSCWTRGASSLALLSLLLLQNFENYPRRHVAIREASEYLRASVGPNDIVLHVSSHTYFAEQIYNGDQIRRALFLDEQLPKYAGGGLASHVTSISRPADLTRYERVWLMHGHAYNLMSITDVESKTGLHRGHTEEFVNIEILQYEVGSR